MQQDLQRAGELVKGLNKFVEGKNGSQEFWNGTLVNQERIHQPNRTTGTARTVSVSSSSPQEIPLQSLSLIRHQTQHSPIAHGASSVSSTHSKPGYTRHPRERKLSLDDTSSSEPESVASLETKLLFSRASSLIRDALKLDGMVFIDACFRDISVTDPMASTSGGSSPEYRFRGGEFTQFPKSSVQYEFSLNQLPCRKL